MRLKELEATKIIKSVMGERGELKSEEELAIILKKRLTKKEMYAMNVKICDADKAEMLTKLNIDESRYEEIIASALKKIKNESVHREFYASIKRQDKTTI